MSKITDRVAAQVGVPDLVRILSELPPTDLQSLLIEVYQARARRAKLPAPAPLTQPSSVDARKLAEFDRAAFAAAASFEAIDLSPVAPFGLSHILGGIDQNNVLTTIRNAEVLGDSTEPLALECARRRRQNRDQEVRLAASHRVVRLQPFDTPGFTPHFRLFALVTASRSPNVADHLRVWLDLCRALKMKNPLVELSDLTITEARLGEHGVRREDVRTAVRAHRPVSQQFLAERGIELPNQPTEEIELAFASLSDYTEAEFRVNGSRLEGLGYYNGLALRISPEAPDGKRYAIIDGGFTDWTARLLSDRKERLLTSGIGSEFVCRVLF